MDALSTQVDAESVNQETTAVETAVPEEVVIYTPQLSSAPTEAAEQQYVNFALIESELEKFNLLYSEDPEASIAARQYALSVPSLARTIYNFQLIMSGMSKEAIQENMSGYDRSYADQNQPIAEQEEQEVQFEVKQEVNKEDSLLESIDEEYLVTFEDGQLKAAIALVNAEVALLNQDENIVGGNVLVQDEYTDEEQEEHENVDQDEDEEEDDEFSCSNDESDSVVDAQPIIAEEISLVVAGTPEVEVALAVGAASAVGDASAEVEVASAEVASAEVEVASAEVASAEVDAEVLVNPGSPLLTAYNNVVDATSTSLDAIPEAVQEQAEAPDQQETSAPSFVA